VGVVKRWVLRGLWRRLVGVGIIGPGLYGVSASIMPLAVLVTYEAARPSPCLPSALRGTSGGANMTTVGGTGTTLRG
jgi:hypothetical protein